MPVSPWTAGIEYKELEGAVNRLESSCQCHAIISGFVPRKYFRFFVAYVKNASTWQWHQTANQFRGCVQIEFEI
jgi:hypothetical protein